MGCSGEPETDTRGGGRPYLGPVYMVLASAAFALMVACVKLVRAELDPMQTVFWRAAISAPLLLIPVWLGPGFRLARRRAFLVRLLFGFAAMSCFYTSAKGLALVDLALISRLQPILVAMLAPMLLGQAERAVRGVWFAAIVGFSGCALLLGPQFGVGSLWGAWALAATAFSACAHLALRRVASGDHGRTIVFWFHIGMGLLAFLALTVRGELPALPSPGLRLPLLGVGVLATAGQLLMTRAYALDRAPVIATASYAGILVSVGLDLVIFDALPATGALLGGALVVGSSLWLVIRSPRSSPPTEGRL